MSFIEEAAYLPVKACMSTKHERHLRKLHEAVSQE